MRLIVGWFAAFISCNVIAVGAEEETSWFWDKILGFFKWVKDTVAAVGEWFDGFFLWLREWFVYAGEYLLWLPNKIWNDLLDAIVGWFEELSTPEFLSSLGSYTATIPCEVWGMVQWAQIPVGIGMLISALILRFLIRRLPIIG